MLHFDSIHPSKMNRLGWRLILQMFRRSVREGNCAIPPAQSFVSNSALIILKLNS